MHQPEDPASRSAPQSNEEMEAQMEPPEEHEDGETSERDVLLARAVLAVEKAKEALSKLTKSDAQRLVTSMLSPLLAGHQLSESQAPQEQGTETNGNSDTADNAAASLEEMLGDVSNNEPTVRQDVGAHEDMMGVGDDDLFASEEHVRPHGPAETAGDGGGGGFNAFADMLERGVLDEDDEMFAGLHEI